MSNLHGYFLLRNQQAFQRLLDASVRAQSVSTAAPLSSSGGKSWNKPSPLSSSSVVPPCDVNARDWLGRTVLHLVVSCLDPAALEYVRLLLGHPKIDINLADTESRWTALHRALYAGNLAACVLLLQRSDIDTSLKDYEGYTAFDVYNSTVEGTKPDVGDEAELFTWGTNRNAALGLGDGDDRTFPDQVSFDSQIGPQDFAKLTLPKRFCPIRVKQVAMSRLHTAVVTCEDRSGNLRVCGFGSGGRLGLGQHTQYSFVPLAQLQHAIDAVALGQDHTLALTRSGDVLSWGLNRFYQLGYVIESASSGLPLRSFGNTDEPIQAVPRRISGPLKKEVVRGVAACKTASVCWTGEELFTWGTNSGQLGYDKAAQPVQILPRKVTQLTQPVVDVAITDSAMSCLLECGDVICFWNGRNFKINFPTQSFPSEIQAYRPPMAMNNALIAKVVSCEYTFAALSRNGEMFTFSLNPPPAGPEQPQTKGNQFVKPQRVWALRKQFSAVKGVALGSAGSIILCTESGHVYVRSRNTKGGQSLGMKTFKFQRIPFLQRVIRVSANSTGAFGALRSDCKPEPIVISGNSLSQDFACIQPYLPSDGSVNADIKQASFSGIAVDVDGDDETDDLTINDDISQTAKLCDLLIARKESKQKKPSIDGGTEFRFGADTIVAVNWGLEFPAHGVILASRSIVLQGVLNGQKFMDGTLLIALSTRQPTNRGKKAIQFIGVHPLTVLVFLRYLYTDELLAVWDRRVGLPMQQRFSRLKITPGDVRSDLQRLSKALNFGPLSTALEAHAKRSPSPSLTRDMQSLLDTTQNLTRLDSAVIPFDSLAPNVVLDLADKEVFCHSTILRARSPFFAGLFDDQDWTAKRWGPDRTIRINLKHMKWRAFSFVIRYVYCGGEGELFDRLDFVQNIDGVLEFMFDVMAVASELLLDRLCLICSDIILRYININNVCSILTDASYFSANQLMASLQGYMARNLETLLESRMLDDLQPFVVKSLASFIQFQQAKKLPLTRSNALISKASEHYGEWLALQDIPQPIIRSAAKGLPRQSPKMSPITSSKRNGRTSAGLITPTSSPRAEPRLTPMSTKAPDRLLRSTAVGEEVFMMDDDIHEEIPPLNLSSQLEVNPATVVSGNSAWKSRLAQANTKTDLRTIMAEAENQRITHTELPSTPKSGQRSGSAADANRSKTSLAWRLPVDAQTSMNASRLLPSTPPRTPGPFDSSNNTPRSSTIRVSKNAMTASPSKQALAPPVSGTVTPSTSSKGKATLGPTFAPTKQAVSMARRTSDSAWATAPAQTPPEAGPSTSPPSFAAIQQQQRDQGAAPTKAKKSLLEIQEEEQARQAEADFLKWWAAEEERIRLETQTSYSTQEKSGRKAKNSRKAPFKGTMTKPTKTSIIQDGEQGERKAPKSRRNKGRASQPPAEQS